MQTQSGTAAPRFFLIGSTKAIGNEKDIREQVRAELDAARRLEAEHHDAMLAVRDAAMLRLFTLKQEILPYVEAMPEAEGFIDIALVPGHPPRLWIDLSSHVLIAEDGRSWRLVQDTADDREILFETDRLEDMAAFLRKFIAHRVVRRHRMIASCHPSEEDAMPPAGKPAEGADFSLLLLVWASGILTGAAGLVAWLVLTGRL